MVSLVPNGSLAVLHTNTNHDSDQFVLSGPSISLDWLRPSTLGHPTGGFGVTGRGGAGGGTCRSPTHGVSARDPLENWKRLRMWS